MAGSLRYEQRRNLIKVHGKTIILTALHCASLYGSYGEQT